MIRDRIKNLRIPIELNNDDDTPKDIMDKAIKMKDIIEQNKQLREENDEVKTIINEHEQLVTYIGKCFGKNKGEHNYFETLARVEQQKKQLREALGSLVNHCVDYNQGAESFVLAMEIEKALKTLKEIGGSGE